MPIDLQADSLDYDQDAGLIEARGDVELQQGPTRLRAERLLWQNATRDVLAQESVELSSPQAELSGDRLRYNLTLQQGDVEGGHVFLRRGNFHLRGDDIEQYGAASFRTGSGRFTTCDGDSPDWSFTAANIDVNVGDYATARHALFRIRDVPILYFPYMIFPAKTERSSGFLIPFFSQSTKRGTSLSLAWYQVIDRNMDATLQLDYMSKLGVGKGLEYRYLFGQDNLGKVNYYHVSGHEDEPDLYALNWQHAGTLPGRVWLSVDAEYVEEQLFFENFGKVADEYNQDKTVTQAWLQRNWRTLNTVLRGRYVRDIENPKANPLQRLPELAVTLAPLRLGESPLYVGVDSSLTRFERDRGLEGERLFLRPALAAAFRVGPWLDFVPELAFSQRFYDTDLGRDDHFLPEITATLGSRFERVYALPGNAAARLKHSIEPTVQYLFRPDWDESDLPSFDPHDRRADVNRVEYALINRLVLREENALGSASYRELLFLRLSQSYDFDLEHQGRTAKDDRFSDLRVEFDLRPTSGSRLYLDALVDMYGHAGFSSLRTGVNVSDTDGNGATIKYVYRDEEFIGSATEYLGASVKTVLLEPVYLNLEQRYDLRDHQTLETVVNLEYRSRCWSLFLEVRDRLEDDLIMIGFELSGLGRIGSGI